MRVWFDHHPRQMTQYFFDIIFMWIYKMQTFLNIYIVESLVIIGMFLVCKKSCFPRLRTLSLAIYTSVLQVAIIYTLN